MSVLTGEIAAFEEMKGKLEARHLGKWVIFRDEELKGIYDSLDDAAVDAARRFGRGPYLIRQIGEPPFRLPASVLYRRVRGDS